LDCGGLTPLWGSRSLGCRGGAEEGREAGRGSGGEEPWRSRRT
jgi:hypothetical protein